jgi:calcium/proton exchanger cax
MSSVPFVLIAAVRETLIAYRNIPYMMKWTAIVSYVSAAILLTFQLIWLVFKYKTHASLFENSAATEEDDDTSSHHSALPGGIGITHPARAAYIVWLAIVLYLAIQCSAKLVTIQYDTFHSRAFVGGVLIPASISASGIFKTCRIAKSGQMQLVLHLTIETAIGLSFFTFPILTIVSAILALDDISQLPSTFNVILFATVFTTGIIIRDGMLTPVKGCMCLALYETSPRSRDICKSDPAYSYMIIVLNLYCHPNMVNEKP